MPPRGRPRKPRLTRMDAAVDAMGQLGFPQDKVKKYVKELLKEYGGVDSWPFIEECSYKELIEAMLRGDSEENDQEQAVKHENLMEDENPEDDAPVEDIAGPSGTAVQEPTLAAPQITNVPAQEEIDNAWKDILPCQSEGSAQDDIGTETKEHSSRNDPPSSANNVPTRRRLPCYGWIESDEEDDVDDFIVLKAAVPREVSKSPIDVNKSTGRRESRWDR
ncbi:hypothetical protein ABFS82_06G068500 [Erythranthe guttata]|nr:PREDICTED: uncharacterized protein LOC105977660 [Erythranthe guttata]|eukprot:XP_012858452.1 PREDICTED: uncharacterized protein LOC105977660 [Erythranthe guttata]